MLPRIERDQVRAWMAALQPLGRQHRPPGQVAVHPFHGLGGRKRQSTGEHLVEGDAERVEIRCGNRLTD